MRFQCACNELNDVIGNNFGRFLWKNSSEQNRNSDRESSSVRRLQLLPDCTNAASTLIAVDKIAVFEAVDSVTAATLLTPTDITRLSTQAPVSAHDNHNPASSNSRRAQEVTHRQSRGNSVTQDTTEQLALDDVAARISMMSHKASTQRITFCIFGDSHPHLSKHLVLIKEQVFR